MEIIFARCKPDTGSTNVEKNNPTGSELCIFSLLVYAGSLWPVHVCACVRQSATIYLPGIFLAETSKNDLCASSLLWWNSTHSLIWWC